MPMLRILVNWLAKRRDIRRRWQADARTLIAEDERGAYYAAQRLAARAKATGDLDDFWHWAKVASEIARLSPHAEMDMQVVQTIADRERLQSRSDTQ